MADALVLSGAGAYADAWHQFVATSARLAGIVEDAGYSVEVTDDVEGALQQLPSCRLLVINIGNPVQPRPADAVEVVRAGLASHCAAGGSLLGVHSTVTALPGELDWPGLLGGVWIRGRTMHPPRGDAMIRLAGSEHPITADLTDFAVEDERYSYLQTEPGIEVLYEHDHDGHRHPLVWAWGRPFDQLTAHRAVYDGLGHDVASYDSPGHQALLQRSVRWLLDAD
jgi:type 1 glutamine amidotransferase